MKNQLVSTDFKLRPECEFYRDFEAEAFSN